MSTPDFGDMGVLLFGEKSPRVSLEARIISFLWPDFWLSSGVN